MGARGPYIRCEENRCTGERETYSQGDLEARGLAPQRGDRPHAGDGEFFKGDEAGGVMGDPHLALPLPHPPPLPRRDRVAITLQAQSPTPAGVRVPVT